MDTRGFNHADVLTCLRKGSAFGPEEERPGVLRAHMVHSGLHVRVVVGGLDEVQGDWSQLQRIVVVTVMEVR
jgi:hypothetical protein